MNDNSNSTSTEEVRENFCAFGDEFSSTYGYGGLMERLTKHREPHIVESSSRQEHKLQQTQDVSETNNLNHGVSHQSGIHFFSNTHRPEPVPRTSRETNPESSMKKYVPGLLEKRVRTMVHSETDNCAEQDKPSIRSSRSDQNGSMVIEITWSESLELLQLLINNTSIGIGSSKIKLIRKNENAKHIFYIFLHHTNQPGPINLRLRTETEPFREFTYQIQYSKKDKRKAGRETSVNGSTSLATPPTADRPKIHNPYEINILLIGRSQVGKSTLIESLNDHKYSSSRTGISQTREPTYKQLKMRSDDGKEYTFNIIDTPGLREIRNDPNETRTDEQLLRLLQKVFDDGRIRVLNMIGFISVMGKTYQNDIETFKSLIKFFGPRFRKISALILTHCDKVSNERIQQLTEELKTHPSCAEVVKYCQLGVHHHGTLDVDDLETYTPELRVRVEELTLAHLLPMRTELKKFLLSRSDPCVEITQTDFSHFREQMGQKAS